MSSASFGTSSPGACHWEQRRFRRARRAKDTKVERNGKIYFDIPEMKYRRRARRAKDTDFFRNRQNFLSEARRIQRKGRKKRYGKGNKTD